MVRRPYLFAAIIVAGLVWLGIFPAALPWEQERTGLPSLHLNLPGPAPALAAKAKPVRPPASENRSKPADTSAQETQTPMDNLVRLLAGGLLAGMLWSVLFGYPFYSYWPDHPFPLGLLDLSVLAVFVYLSFMVIKAAIQRNHGPPAPAGPTFLRCNMAVPLTVTVGTEAEQGLSQITASDPAFALCDFGEFARRVMLNLHNSWNQQDLSPLSEEVTENLMDYLNMGLKMMNLRGEVSRLEDLHLTRLVVIAAGQEGDKDFITLRLEGQVMDYILQKCSYKLVSGSLTYPTELREVWRFERRRDESSWKLTDIQDH